MWKGCIFDKNRILIYNLIDNVIIFNGPSSWKQFIIGLFIIGLSIQMHFLQNKSKDFPWWAFQISRFFQPWLMLIE